MNVRQEFETAKQGVFNTAYFAAEPARRVKIATCDYMKRCIMNAMRPGPSLSAQWKNAQIEEHRQRAEQVQPSPEHVVMAEFDRKVSVIEDMERRAHGEAHAAQREANAGKYIEQVGFVARYNPLV